MLVICPECNKKLTVPESAAGKKARCPGCQKILVVPRGEGVATPDPAPRWETPTLEAADEPEPVGVAPPKSVLRCAKCKAPTLEKLPPNQFSRNPGYVCTGCGATMRPPGTTGTYLVIIVLGGFVVLLGVVPAAIALTADNHRGMLFLGTASLVVLGIASTGWAARQLFLPVPLDAPKRPSRLLFKLVVLFLGMLAAAMVLGVCLIGLLYYMHARM